LSIAEANPIATASALLCERSLADDTPKDYLKFI